MSSEIINRSIVEWRQKARAGQLTVEEMKIALALIRAERQKSGEVSAKSTTTKKAAAKKAAPIDSDELLKGLMG